MSARLLAVVRDPRTLAGFGLRLTALGVLTYGSYINITNAIRDVEDYAERLDSIVDAELVEVESVNGAAASSAYLPVMIRLPCRCGKMLVTTLVEHDEHYCPFCKHCGRHYSITNDGAVETDCYP